MSSRRAEILKRLLPHITTGDYDEYDGYVVFGASSVFDMIDDIATSSRKREDDSPVEAARELASDLTRHRGRSSVARRVSLHHTPPFKATSKQGSRLLEALEKYLGEKFGDTEPIPP